MCSNKRDVEYLFPQDTKVIHFNGNAEKYTALLRSRCRNKEEFRQKWLKQYEKLSRVTLRVLLTRPKTGKIVVYKAVFRCQHNTYPASHQRVKTPHKKHTGCPATLKVTIKASPKNRRVRSVDALRKEYPTIISINHDHNHHLPSQGFLCLDDFIVKNEESEANSAKLNCKPVTSYWHKKFKSKDEFLVEELDWSLLKESWTAFLEKWESSNSVLLYNAVLKATCYLKNCKTVNSTIAALNFIGEKTNKRKYKSKVGMQLNTGSNNKMHLNRMNNNKQNLPIKIEVSNALDELLVIDQGWIT